MNRKLTSLAKEVSKEEGKTAEVIFEEEGISRKKRNIVGTKNPSFCPLVCVFAGILFESGFSNCLIV